MDHYCYLCFLFPWESNKYTIKHHTQESQEVIPFPAGDHKGTMNRQEKNDKHETQITKMIKPIVGSRTNVTKL